MSDLKIYNNNINLKEVQFGIIMKRWIRDRFVWFEVLGF